MHSLWTGKAAFEPCCQSGLQAPPHPCSPSPSLNTHTNNPSQLQYFIPSVSCARSCCEHFTCLNHFHKSLLGCRDSRGKDEERQFPRACVHLATKWQGLDSTKPRWSTILDPWMGPQGTSLPWARFVAFSQPVTDKRAVL